MDIRELKIFRHLAMSLHFAKSARECHVTASTLTRIIQRMEEELGKKLFIRDNRTVELSPAGTIFREYVEDVIGRWETMQNQLSSEQKLAGEISLYCSVTAAYSILPVILQTFREIHPEVHIKLQTGDAAQALGKLENREIDIVIAALPEALSERLLSMPIMETPLVCIGPSRFPETVIRHNDEIDWQRTPQVVAEIGLSRERVDAWLRKKDVQPNIYAEVAGNEAIIAMVSLGCGIGVVPELVLEKSPVRDKIEILEKSAELSPFIVGICTSRKSMERPQIKAFWKVAEKEGGSI